MPWSVFDICGNRKYLNRLEVERLLLAAAYQDEYTYAFCRLLAETGCRISEALAITARRIDTDQCFIVFESLKKRRRGIFRAVPISPTLAASILALPTAMPDARIWRWSRMTAWRHIHGLLEAQGITGPQASPKGFRHGFAMGALGAGVPITLVQRWLGHSDIRTTALYTNAAGPEEMEFAQRLRAHYLTAFEPNSLNCTVQGGCDQERQRGAA